MKDYLISLTKSAANQAHARNIMREYLQARILAALQQSGAMIPLAFHGGTAQHHDRASLLAGKLHAILQRPYTKGRDIYDLVWYLSDPNWPPPNLVLFRQALAQTGWSGAPITETNWRELVSARLLSANWERLRADVAPFLERQAELSLLSAENLKHLLQTA